MAGPVGSRREAHGSKARVDERLTLRATVEYDGSRFCGFQFQPTVRSVAGEIESALAHLLNEPVALTGAGRTDTGVHASGQVVSFSTARSFPFDRLAIALNSRLPSDISIRSAEIVSSAFSARFSAIERTYVYALYNRPNRDALVAERAYHVYRSLDVDAMYRASRALLGEHDFRSFCGTLPERGGTVRTVRSISIEHRDRFVRIEIRANGFLHRMVRTIVGTLVECGTGRREADTVAAILAARDRRRAGLTAPPHGLYLAGVRYDDGFDSFSEPAVFPW